MAYLTTDTATGTQNAAGTATFRYGGVEAVFPPGGIKDWPGTTKTKAVSGHVYNSSGVPVVGATVLLFRASDEQYIATTTSTAGGVYSFARDTADPYSYYTVAYSVVSGSVQIHGVSNRTLVPA